MDRQQEIPRSRALHLFNAAVIGLAGCGLLMNFGFSAAETRPKTPPFAQSTRLAPSPPAGVSPVAAVLQRDALTAESAPFPSEPAVAAKPSSIAKPAIAERAVVKAIVAPSVPAKAIQRPLWTELELQRQLITSVPVVGMEDDQKLTGLLERLKSIKPPKSNSNLPSLPEDLVLASLDEEDYSALPFAWDQNCQLSHGKAESLDRYAEQVHDQIDLIDRSLKRRFPHSAPKRMDPALAYAIKKGRKWRRGEALPAMMQILQIRPERIRGEIVEKASKFSTADATGMLVNRAVYDLSPEVRTRANEALKKREPDLYRDDLLEALRYPWPAAAWNAAETLAAVNDQEAIPELIELLDAPDPAKPHRDETGRIVVRELVRLNHLKNCLLCHARTADENDPVTAFVPLPRSRAYYQAPESGVLVRADVTYLRQDFSLAFPGEGGIFPSPAEERFDYLVRTREISRGEYLLRSREIARAEYEELATKPEDSTHNYPQRDAVLFALQKLSGKILGPEPAAWRRLYADQVAAK